MPDLEFTGERVIPGLVESHLFNEHIARYRFAANFAGGRYVLDAGCGSGYGTELLREAGSVVAIDFSHEAVNYARTHFAHRSVEFLQSRCESLPFADGVFEMITAFEVIEHLGNWPAMLTEANRVLSDTGLLLVSTPNKAYYSETRAGSGPNPFHVHEFEHAEFVAALEQVFTHVQVVRQNHSEAIVFSGTNSVRQGEMLIGGQTPEDVPHFFLALCSRSPLRDVRPFAWIPDDANMLRERERHIALLQREVAQKTVWMDAMEAEIAQARRVISNRDSELEKRNEWVEDLRAELAASKASVTAWKQSSERLEAELRSTHDGYKAKILQVEVESAEIENLRALEHARLELEIADLHQGYQLQIEQASAQITDLHAAYRQEIARIELEVVDIHRGYRDALAETTRTREAELAGYQAAIERLEAELVSVQRSCTAAIQKLETDLGICRETVRAVQSSKWIKIGNRVGLGPVITNPE